MEIDVNIIAFLLLYLVLGVVISLFRKYSLAAKKIFAANNFLIGVLSGILLIIMIWELVNSGAFWERYIFYSRTYGKVIYLKWMIIVLSLAFPLLNLSKRPRNNLILQGVIIFLLLARMMFDTLFFGPQATSVIPGWHTTISPMGFFWLPLYWSLWLLPIMVLLNGMLIGFKLLTEFKEEE